MRLAKYLLSISLIVTCPLFRPEAITLPGGHFPARRSPLAQRALERPATGLQADPTAAGRAALAGAAVAGAADFQPLAVLRVVHQRAAIADKGYGGLEEIRCLDRERRKRLSARGPGGKRNRLMLRTLPGQMAGRPQRACLQRSIFLPGQGIVQQRLPMGIKTFAELMGLRSMGLDDKRFERAGTGTRPVSRLGLRVVPPISRVEFEIIYYRFAGRPIRLHTLSWCSGYHIVLPPCPHSG